ncbi:IS66 family insertion sequence element accessory protein TnpA [Clostridium butyricum]|uniref:IS66 family insertion sequence element accessory protein TnpA n=1 Tax=Clostridium butyricum TaxID=1492 RepID=UPI003D34BA05
MNEDKTVDWKAMIDKLALYSGTIKDFCKENNIAEKKFYYHRRKLSDKNKVVFHEIPLKSESNPTVSNSNTSDIKIEIGKATIYIPANEIAALTAIVRNLISSV